jgi:hypothetical protein
MGRSQEDSQLDVQVAIRLFGFRWVEWNETALGGGPLYTPGRFLVPPDYPTAHLLKDAPDAVPPHEHATAKVPEYSQDVTCAYQAAERAGLFSVGRATLYREGGGNWVVEVRGLRLSSPQLPEVICRASLEYAGAA